MYDCNTSRFIHFMLALGMEARYDTQYLLLLSHYSKAIVLLNLKCRIDFYIAGKTRISCYLMICYVCIFKRTYCELLTSYITIVCYSLKLSD